MAAGRKQSKPKKVAVWVTTDSEFQMPVWICNQHYFVGADGKGRVGLYFTDRVPQHVRELWQVYVRDNKIDCHIEYVADGTPTIPLFRARHGLEDANVFVVNYFSPKDLEFAFGWDNVRQAIVKKRLRQRNNLSGSVGKVRVKDPFGWYRRSLERFAEALGIANDAKALMTRDDKKRMWEILQERPLDFFKYVTGDVTILHDVVDKFVSLQRGIQEVLGIKDQWTRETIPMTTGSVVARTFEQWLHRMHGEYEDLFKFCVRKQGILDPEKTKRYEKGLALLNKYYSLFPNALAMHNRRKNHEVWWLLKHARFRHTALDGGSIRWFASLDANETAIFNAVVQGGRCNNEVPEEYLAEYGLDIDISGCYGAALRSFTFPVGLPTVWSYSLNQEDKPTLGEWLRQNGDELVPGLWQVVVRGELSFPQDLIYSRDVGAADIRKAIQSRWFRDKDDNDITSKTMLLRHQVLNGVITSDILEVLLQTATERERKEILSLRVWTAAAYLKSDRCNDLMSWANRVVPDTGRHANETGKAVEDNRTRAWLAVPLEGYIGRMCDARAALKAKKKQEGLSAEEKARLMGLDEIFKVNINTVYGTLASRFFAIGNTILANNITARGRVGVWMLAKALRLRQTITDGGIYEPASVAWWKGPKPGLATLADMYDWKMKCRRGFTSLGGLDWKAAITSKVLPEDLDALALAHVKEFWAPYGLEFPFRKVEHKKENTFIRAAYLFKADYGLDRAGFHDAKDPARHFCLRGKDRDARAKGKNQHPSFTWLANILDGSDAFPDDLTHTKGGILTIKQWVQNQGQDVGEELKALRPGDSLPERTYTQRYNNVHMRLADYDDWKGRYDRKKVVRGKPNRWFERYGASGTRAVHKAMLNNRRLGDDIVSRDFEADAGVTPPRKRAKTGRRDPVICGQNRGPQRFVP